MSQLQGIELFIDVFMLLDKAHPEGVQRQELIKECQARKLSLDQINEWLKPFPTDIIDLETFCKHLGFDLNSMRLEEKERAKSRENTGQTVANDIEVISTTMSVVKQVDITEKFKELVKKIGTDASKLNTIPEQLKAYMDEKYLPGWQVIMLEGSYWMHFSHEPLTSLQFRYDSLICLIWRTPMN
ncbi:Calcium binding protein containing EF hand domain [Paragonimus heterotremus]|uniref:Calcium binding protein containing EF hand domain n=1 Tax=Paragonimus heterotremus TaxID=100268 RepID=A0A8J4T765_9TREM|nr:Calcium binding protein containing EF hand domain [Paragonimus heterotremus]